LKEKQEKIESNLEGIKSLVQPVMNGEKRLQHILEKEILPPIKSEERKKAQEEVDKIKGRYAERIQRMEDDLAIVTAEEDKQV